MINELTFSTKAGSALVPISTNALIIGLKMVNLAGKCNYKTFSTFYIPPLTFAMLTYTNYDPAFNFANSATAS